MNAQHTPGPWQVQDDDRVDGCRFIPIETEISSGPKSRLICEVQPNYCEKGGALSETDRANARLIAAAPDLLASLQAVMAMLTERGVVLECMAKPTPLIELLNTQAEFDALETARGAITKARGEA